VNFFDPHCQRGPFNQAQFGLCDDQVAGVAYVDFADVEKWTATVNNPEQKAVTFTAVDKCVIKDSEETGRGRCDCMLTTDEGLYLVELKDMQYPGWRGLATQQLESTIVFLIETHGKQALKKYRHKKAFACNKKNKPFATIDNERQNYFFKTYRFRLDIQATVLIVS
jgi:hypothetical protein